MYTYTIIHQLYQKGHFVRLILSTKTTHLRKPACQEGFTIKYLESPPWPDSWSSCQSKTERCSFFFFLGGESYELKEELSSWPKTSDLLKASGFYILKNWVPGFYIFEKHEWQSETN